MSGDYERPADGYHQRLGYSPVGGGQPVPGAGPILGVRHYRGCVYAIRSDGEVPRLYAETETGWEMVRPIWDEVL